MIPAKLYNRRALSGFPMELTAVLRKSEKYYVALCPEVDVVSQGRTVEEATRNLQEAVELYIEEMGIPEHVAPAIITRITVHNAKTAQPVR